MGGRFGVAWRAELCDAERTCGVRLAELAPPFDSANRAKLAAIAQRRPIRAGPALTRETHAPPVHLLGGRDQKSRIQRAFACCSRVSLTAADPCGHRASRRGRRPRLQLITNHLSLGAASDTDALQLGNVPSLIPAASAEDAGWAEALAMA
jgi:hypothetical protein